MTQLRCSAPPYRQAAVSTAERLVAGEAQTDARDARARECQVSLGHDDTDFENLMTLVARMGEAAGGRGALGALAEADAKGGDDAKAGGGGGGGARAVARAVSLDDDDGFDDDAERFHAYVAQMRARKRGDGGDGGGGAGGLSAHLSRSGAVRGAGEAVVDARRLVAFLQRCRPVVEALAEDNARAARKGGGADGRRGPPAAEAKRAPSDDGGALGGGEAMFAAEGSGGAGGGGAGGGWTRLGGARHAYATTHVPCACGSALRARVRMHVVVHV